LVDAVSAGPFIIGRRGLDGMTDLYRDIMESRKPRDTPWSETSTRVILIKTDEIGWVSFGDGQSASDIMKYTESGKWEPMTFKDMAIIGDVFPKKKKTLLQKIGHMMGLTNN
jgi:hypothetical protein